MDAVKTLKVNLKLDNKPCGWCEGALTLGEDAAVCTACDREHHQRCWDARAGCSTAGCANAPLRRLDPPVAGTVNPMAASLAAGLMYCPGCRHPIPVSAPICPSCRAIASPDGIYHGPKINAVGATASLVYGIIGLFICGIVLGPVAISKASSAKQAIRSDPTLSGNGLATAGVVLGVLDIVGFVIIMLVRLSVTK